jgi:hypothetical protein
MQILGRPLRDMRNNTDAILQNTECLKHDVHGIDHSLQDLNKTLQELPSQIQSSSIQIERVGHDAFQLGAVEFGTLGLVVGLIFGLFLSRGSK